MFQKNDVIAYNGGRLYIVDALVKIKQDDDSWADGVVYTSVEDMKSYVRRLDQMSKFTKV